MHISHRQLFFQHLAQTSDFPLALEIDIAEGVFMFDTAGKRYFDLISGIAVSNVGHRHPEVLEAIQSQLDKYLHLMVYGEFVQSPQVLLAEELVKSLAYPCAHPSPYGSPTSVYFTNSGTEAVEAAMKLAKRFTGRSEFIACANAYHGATQGALSLSGAEFFKNSFRPLLPDIRQILHGSFADLDKITNRTAAVIIEIIGGEAGVRLPPDDYFKALRQQCTATGTLLIVDEIQTGFGRTGTFWASESAGIGPDVILSAKGMGGGMPLGALMASSEVMNVFKTNPLLGHITTFGGHPVSCAASLATLKVIQSNQLDRQAMDKGDLFRQLLVHPKIKEVRGKGLLLAAEFESFDVLKPIIDRCLSQGVVTDWFLFCDHSMRIAPPLIITHDQIREATALILNTLD
jgi:acetylornithine/succinyldiaminopimelate/putrescine aminotransferase